MKLLIHSQTSTAAPLKFGNGQVTTLYNGCNYLSMLGLKLNHVSITKKGPLFGTRLLSGNFLNVWHADTDEMPAKIRNIPNVHKVKFLIQQINSLYKSCNTFNGDSNTDARMEGPTNKKQTRQPQTIYRYLPFCWPGNLARKWSHFLWWGHCPPQNPADC